MALTSGDKQKQSTVSSIQSRMGVVDTYSGDGGLALAAQGASKVLSAFGERQANIEEVAWKTDFKLKSRQTLTELSRVHYDDPDGFTKATDSYISTLVNEAPTRFKNYAKEFTGNIAFQYGDQIWQEAKAQKDIVDLANFATNHKEFIAFREEAIMKMNPNEMQSYWTESLLPEMSDSVIDYEKVYNSYPASIQQQLANQLGTPDEFRKSLSIGFETTRLISQATFNLQNAQAIDTAVIQQAGKIPEGYKTEVSKVMEQLNSWGKNYIDNPEHDETAGAEVYKDTDRIDREGILKDVQLEIDKWNQANEANVKKQQIVLSQDKEESVIQTIALIEDGYVYPDEELRVIAQNIGANEDQLDRLLDANTKMKIIKDVSSNISSFTQEEESGEYMVSSKLSGFEIDQELANKTRYLNDMGIEITKDELMQEAMNQQMFEVINTIAPEIGRNVYNNMDLSSVLDDGTINDNLLLTSLLNISKVYGAVPERIDTYFASADTFNFEQSDDRKQLRIMSEFANNLNLTKGRKLSFKNDKANELFPQLLELHKELSKVKRLDDKLADLTEKQLNDLNIDTHEQEKLVIENWYSQINPDTTTLDEKLNKIDDVMQESNIDWNKLTMDFVEDAQEDGPWWGFGFADTDLMTGNNEFNIMYRDKDLEPSFNFVVQEIESQIKLRIASSFNNKNFLSTMTEDSIKKAYKEQLPYILNTVRLMGYGYDEN